MNSDPVTIVWHDKTIELRLISVRDDKSALILFSGISQREIAANPELNTQLDETAKVMVNAYHNIYNKPLEQQPLTGYEEDAIREARRLVDIHDESRPITQVYAVIISKLAYRNERLTLALKTTPRREFTANTDGISLDTTWSQTERCFIPTAVRIGGTGNIEIPYKLIRALDHFATVDLTNHWISIVDPTTYTTYKLRILAQSRNIDGAYMCQLIR